MDEVGGIVVVEGKGEVSNETVGGAVTAEEADCVLLLLLLLLLLWTKAIFCKRATLRDKHLIVQVLVTHGPIVVVVRVGIGICSFSSKPFFSSKCFLLLLLMDEFSRADSIK